MRTALVTGAGSGIGRAIGVALGNSGFRLALVGRRHAALAETAELIDGPETLLLSADVTDASQAAQAVDDAAAALDRLDVLVNNAGYGELVPMENMSAAVWDSAIAFNASSAAYCSIAAWPHLCRQGGTIINIASMAVYDPFPGFMAYGAAKAAMAHLTVSFANEGAARGVTAYCLCPGAVETALLRSAIDQRTLPPDQVLQPHHVAAVALACVRGERVADNGRTIAVLPDSALDWWARWSREHASGWLGMSPAR